MTPKRLTGDIPFVVETLQGQAEFTIPAAGCQDLPHVDDPRAYKPDQYLSILRGAYNARCPLPRRVPLVGEHLLRPHHIEQLTLGSFALKEQQPDYAQELVYSWHEHAQALSTLGAAALQTSFYNEDGSMACLQPLANLSLDYREGISARLFSQWWQLVRTAHSLGQSMACRHWSINSPVVGKPLRGSMVTCWRPGLLLYGPEELQKALEEAPNKEAKAVIMRFFIESPQGKFRRAASANGNSRRGSVFSEGEDLNAWQEHIFDYADRFGNRNELAELVKNRQPGQEWPMSGMDQLRRVFALLATELWHESGVHYTNHNLTESWEKVVSDWFKLPFFTGDIRDLKIIFVGSDVKGARQVLKASRTQKIVEATEVRVQGLMYDRLFGEAGLCGKTVWFYTAENCKGVRFFTMKALKETMGYDVAQRLEYARNYFLSDEEWRVYRDTGVRPKRDVWWI